MVILCVMKGDTQEKWHHAILPERKQKYQELI